MLREKHHFLRKVILVLAAKGFFRFMPDKIYLQMIYWAELGKGLNIKKPQSFNEKLNWKKLYDRNPLYTTLADKYQVKEYVANIIGEKYVIPLYGVWDRFEDIDFSSLPEKFVLKTTHDSGGVVVCKDKHSLDYKQTQKILEGHLKKNYFYWRREWPYKNIVPRIIAEEYVKDGENDHLPVYKFFCFHGVPEIIQTIQNDKQPNETIDYFDHEWNLLDLRQNFPNSQTPLSKPEKLDEMLEIASKLSEGFDFIRVDLYLINGKIKFSEFTFYSDAGINIFDPPKWDLELGDKIVLPHKK